MGEGVGPIMRVYWEIVREVNKDATITSSRFVKKKKLGTFCL